MRETAERYLSGAVYFAGGVGSSSAPQRHETHIDTSSHSTGKIARAVKHEHGAWGSAAQMVAGPVMSPGLAMEIDAP